MIDEFEQVVDALFAAKNVAIYTHINTDCDAMGSSLALREALLELGKNVDVFINSDFPDNFKFYGDLSFVNKKTCDRIDLAVCLDCATESRLGKYKYTYRKGVKNTLLIDHHITVTERYCKINYVRRASSTAELLFDIIEALRATFSKDICKNLLSGIVTDTGKFVHTTSSKTFEIASKLLTLSKLRMEDICEPLFNSMSLGVFEMLKLAYQRLEFYSDHKVALLMFEDSDFKKFGITLHDLDAFPDLPLELNVVKFAILASEDDKGYFRVSMRSKGEVSARAVAESFGGGGHFNASGCKIFGDKEEVKQRLIDNTLEVLGWKK